MRPLLSIYHDQFTMLHRPLCHQKAEDVPQHTVVCFWLHCEPTQNCVSVQVPFALVFTKTDKRKKKCPGAAENIAAFQKELLADWQVRRHPQPFIPNPYS
jgi:hypothetical protein